MSFLPIKIITIISDHSERTFLSQTSSEDTPPPDRETNKILRRFSTRPELPPNLLSDYTNSKYFIDSARQSNFKVCESALIKKRVQTKVFRLLSLYTNLSPLEKYLKYLTLPKQINPNKFKSCMKEFRLNLIKEIA